MSRIIRQNRSAFLEGLSLDIDIDVPGNFWVRSEELNVETAGAVDLRFDPGSQNLQMFGQVNAVRGFYNVRAVLDLALAYAKERVQFGQSISKFQAIQFKIADMEMKTSLARSAYHRAAWLKDGSTPCLCVVRSSTAARPISPSFDRARTRY